MAVHNDITTFWHVKLLFTLTVVRKTDHCLVYELFGTHVGDREDYYFVKCEAVYLGVTKFQKE